MNETPTQEKRTKAVVDQEYSTQAMHAGDLEFKLKQITFELCQIYEKMGNLNVEAGTILKESESPK